MEEAFGACVSATRDFVQAAGYEDCVIGLSGGIDSGLVAAIAAEALGAEHVHCVLLPGPFSSSHSVDDALDLCGRLALPYDIVSIDEPCAAFSNVLSAACGGALEGVALQNVQARSRMVCIMALSNARGWLMLNTGNRTEAYMGYSTLYGDMAGAYAPIGSLWKTEVFSMARWLNERAAMRGECEPIPQHMIEKPPSAELADGQTDEGSLGITYELLDRILVAHVDEGLGRGDLLEQGFSEPDVDLVFRRIAGSAFKRPLEPPAPALPRTQTVRCD